MTTYAFSLRLSVVCLNLILVLSSGFYAQTYAVIAKNSGLALDVTASSRQDGARIVQWPYEERDNQHFVFEALGGDVFVIRAEHSRKALTAPSGNGIDLYQAEYNGSEYQHFKVLPAGDDYYHLVNVANGKYLDVTANSNQPGVQIVLWTKHGGPNQAFRLKEVYNGPAFICERGKTPERSDYYFTVTNKSMWDVSFRVKSGGSWSEWKYANISANPKAVSLSASGQIEDFEIMWKDLATWKYFGATPIIPDNDDMKLTVTGNTFTGIKID